jgi:23S rRNA (uracil1939-C5)-methyltransferase
MNTRKPSRAPHPALVSIAAVGHKGDGIADIDGRTIYVPLTLAGDRARVEIEGERARLVELLAPGPERIAAACRHFGACGGCALQHMALPAYAAWKRELVVQALAQRGFDGAPIAPTLVLPPHVRRRVVLKAVKTQAKVVVGFNRRAAHEVIDIDECAIARPAIVEHLPCLRAALECVLPPKAFAKIALCETDAGLDCAVEGEGRPSLAALQALADYAARADLARVSWNGDPIATRRAPFVTFAGVTVALPAKYFLQASREAEEALTALVRESLVREARGPIGRVADLFAGLGTFSIPLAAHARVHAYDGEATAMTALAQAARANGLPILAERRDLFRRPLSGDELSGFDAVVLDPPRAGAEAQCAALAASARVPRVVIVSCSPASFARDARLLVEGGYRLETVTPVDQFRWSAHVELVASFSR